MFLPGLAPWCVLAGKKRALPGRNSAHLILKFFDLHFGFGTTRALLVALWSHVAQSLGLLLLAIDFAIQSSICGSGNDANNFPGRCLALGIHFGSPEVDLVLFGLLTPTGHCSAIGLLSIGASL